MQDAEHNIPDWEECIFRTRYSNISSCIPEYMQVLNDLPVMDDIAQQLNDRKKTAVRAELKEMCMPAVIAGINRPLFRRWISAGHKGNTSM